MKVTRADLRQLQRDNAKHPIHMRRMDQGELESQAGYRGQLEVWRSRNFLVQIFAAENGALERWSINRTMIDRNGEWIEGIGWDDIQQIKQECGRGELAAVEIYPPDQDIANVANIRHIWVLAEAPGFMWRGNSG